MFAHSWADSHLLFDENLSLPEICFSSQQPTATTRLKRFRKLSWFVWVSLNAYLNGEGIKVVQHYMVRLWEQCRVTLETKQNHSMNVLCWCVGFFSREVFVKWISSIMCIKNKDCKQRHLLIFQCLCWEWPVIDEVGEWGVIWTSLPV